MLPYLGKLEDEDTRSLISNDRDFNVGIRASLDYSPWFFETRGNRKGIVVVVQVQYKLISAGGRILIIFNLEWTATIVTPES